MALDLIFPSWTSPSSSSQIWHQGAALVSSTRHPLGLKVSIHSCLNAVAFGLSRYPISLFVAQRAFHAPLQDMRIPSMLFEGDWRRPQFIGRAPILSNFTYSRRSFFCVLLFRDNSRYFIYKGFTLNVETR